MKDFEQWYKELISEERWHETMQMQHKGKSIKEAARIVYGDAVSDSLTFEKIPFSERRKHVHYKLLKMPVKQQAPVLQQVEVSEDKEWKPVSEEERQRRLKEYKELIDSLEMVNNFPRVSAKELMENGDWKPARVEPRSDIQKAMVVEEHIRKVREARSKVFRSYYPDASDLEVEAYCNKFSDV